MTESETMIKKRLAWVFHGTRGTSHSTDLVWMKDFKYIVIRRAWLWAFLFVFIMGSIGLWGLHKNQTEIRHFEKTQAVQQYRQAMDTCLASNDGRKALLDLLRTSNVSTQAIKEDPSYPPAFLDLIRQTKAQSAENLANNELKLAPRDCQALFKKP